MAQQGQIVDVRSRPELVDRLQDPALFDRQAAPHQRYCGYNSMLLAANAVTNPLDMMRSASAAVIWLLAGDIHFGAAVAPVPTWQQ